MKEVFIHWKKKKEKAKGLNEDGQTWDRTWHVEHLPEKKPAAADEIPPLSVRHVAVNSVPHTYYFRCELCMEYELRKPFDPFSYRFTLESCIIDYKCVRMNQNQLN